MDDLIDEMRIGSEDEAGFVRDARHGDRQAFAVLVHRHWDRIYRWLFHLTHDVEGAEAATRETFQRAYAELLALEPDFSFHGWLCRIAREAAERDSGPRRKVRLRAPRQLRGRDEAPPELARVRTELRQLLERVGRLPRTLRGAYLLRTEAGFRFAEIARILDIPEKHARMRVRMARERLMQALYVPSADSIEEPGCQAHRQRLLRAEELSPDERVAEHLAICWTCSDWHEQLSRIETRSASIFVPPSRGRDRYLRHFLDPEESSSTDSAPVRRRRFGWNVLVLGAAVVLLVLAGVWLGDVLSDWAASADAPRSLSKPSN
jgi:RNA polymerase sigma-70 factor, ECF subfamily